MNLICGFLREAQASLWEGHASPWEGHASSWEGHASSGKLVLPPAGSKPRRLLGQCLAPLQVLLIASCTHLQPHDSTGMHRGRKFKDKIGSLGHHTHAHPLRFH